MADGPSGGDATTLRCSDALVVAVWPDRLEVPDLGEVVDRDVLQLLVAFADGRHRAISHAARSIILSASRSRRFFGVSSPARVPLDACSLSPSG